MRPILALCLLAILLIAIGSTIGDAAMGKPQDARSRVRLEGASCAGPGEGCPRFQPAPEIRAIACKGKACDASHVALSPEPPAWPIGARPPTPRTLQLPEPASAYGAPGPSFPPPSDGALKEE